MCFTFTLVLAIFSDNFFFLTCSSQSGTMKNPIIAIALLFWTLVKVCFWNFVGFIDNIIPTSWKPQKDVSKEIVLITGGGMGIGRLMSLSFAKLGSTVVIWDINGAAAEGVVKEIR